MTIRFRRSIKIFPGLRINVGKKSASLSLGGRGAHVTLGPNGTRTTVGIPGTGLSSTHLSRHAVGVSESLAETGKPPRSLRRRLIFSLLAFMIFSVAFSHFESWLFAK
jgi:hypothetical protein